MLWSRRRALVAGLAVLPLAACLRPVHAPGGPGAALRGQVRADDPQTPQEFAFVGALEDRLGRAQAARFQLSYDLRLRERGGARVRDLGDTRFQIFGTLDYILSDSATGDEVQSGTLQNVTAYSATANQLATRMAQEDAERRLMRILANALATRLVAAMPTDGA